MKSKTYLTSNRKCKVARIIQQLRLTSGSLLKFGSWSSSLLSSILSDSVDSEDVKVGSRLTEALSLWSVEALQKICFIVNKRLAVNQLFPFGNYNIDMRKFQGKREFSLRNCMTNT